MKEQLQQGFSPDDSFPLGMPLFLETPCPASPLALADFQSFDEVMFATLFFYLLLQYPSISIITKQYLFFRHSDYGTIWAYR